MKLIIGLGNPGSQYEQTRHNIGFRAVDAFAKSKNIEFNKDKFNGVFYKGDDFIIAKPMTYMNLSGDFAQQIVKFFKIDVKDIMVIYDDMDTEVGKVKMKTNGSGGGQNGIKDIIKKLGTPEILRMKIGIGRNHIEAKDYVLGKFTKEDTEKLNPLIKKIISGINDFIENDSTQKVISNFNTK